MSTFPKLQTGPAAKYADLVVIDSGSNITVTTHTSYRLAVDNLEVNLPDPATQSIGDHVELYIEPGVTIDVIGVNTEGGVIKYYGPNELRFQNYSLGRLMFVVQNINGVNLWVQFGDMVNELPNVIPETNTIVYDPTLLAPTGSNLVITDADFESYRRIVIIVDPSVVTNSWFEINLDTGVSWTDRELVIINKVPSNKLNITTGANCHLVYNGDKSSVNDANQSLVGRLILHKVSDVYVPIHMYGSWSWVA